MRRYGISAPTAVALALLSALSPPATAQRAGPALMVKLGEKSEPLRLASVDTEVRIVGYLAETRMTMTFANPHARALAGDLYFPLPQGATVSGYALDVKGKLVDGVAVEKARARQVFEKIVRQGVDPGLVEWVKGNNFKTRVFPIPAKGTRTVRVDYVADLVDGRDGPAYHLPLTFRRKVGRFRLRVEVVQGTAQPIVREGGLANFKFAKWRRGYAAETVLADVALTKDLVVGLPDVAKQPVVVERGPDGQHYFCINDFPARPPEGPAARLGVPKLVTVLWDASGSRGRIDHKREIALLQSCLDFLACGRALPNAKFAGFDVDLVVFRDRAEPPKRFRWNNLNVRRGGVLYREDLRKVLHGMQYDGGTQMAAVSPPAGAERPDYYLLFTDGISNFGLEDPTDLGRPVYVFSADPVTNHPFLRYLAMKTGGEYFNLARLEDDAVLRSIGRPPYAFLSIASAGAKVDETYPRLVEPIQGRFTLVGRLTGEEARIKLNYGTKGKVLNSSDFTVSRATAGEGNLLRRFWAQKKVDDLQVFPRRNEERITEVGKRYSIVTPGTSLIVLESLEQYLEHHIAPPKSLPDMYAEYQRRMDTLEMQRKRKQAAKIDKVLAMWRDRVKWWQKEFTYPKDFKYTPPKAAKGRRAAAGGEGAAVPATATPDAAPAPRRPAARAGAPRPTAPPTPAGGRAAEEADTTAIAVNGVVAAGEDRARSGKARLGRPGVLIKPWDPKTPYLAALRAAPADKQLDVYMQQRKAFGTSPAFFLDCAEFFHQAGQDEPAVRVLSNVAELELENAALIRVLAHKLAQWDRLELAAMLFEKVLKLRPEEPQSYRDLALVLARREQYARAVELLWQVVTKRWDGRFPRIEAIVLMELNRLVPKAKAAGVDLEKLGLDPRLIKLLDCDVRVVLTWDADMTDIDLWVIEPSGEKVFYSHNRSTIGGRMSRDFTRGYGPEEYLLKKAMHGVYRIKVNYYGSSAAKLLGAVTLQADVFANFGRPNEQRKTLTLRLRTKKETVQIGEIEF